VWHAAVVNGAKRAARRRWLDAARHPTRRDGAVLWALLLLPWVVALVLVRGHHHLDSGAVGIVAAFCVGLPTLWVTWAAYRDARRSDTPVSGLSMVQVADRLAVAVGTQWENEAAVRRLNDPWPLPVSWAAADPSLTDTWDSLARLAVSGAGWPASSHRATWASGPGDLAGTGGELAGVLIRVPTGRLVVLGEPGAGKTMLMVRLVLDLLGRRDPGGPVPFLASVASSAPSDQDLRSWLAARLVIDHPALAARPPAGGLESTQAAALLASGLILPVLDGLDEIPEKVRGQAISQINDALRPGQPPVVTCRTQQYRDAVRPQDGPEVTLRAAAAVQLRPLDADAVRDYLSDDAAGPAARARWAPVLAVLDTEAAPVAQALSTPLMVGLTRAIYNPRPGEVAGALRDPAELCNPVLPDRRAVESLLFDAFIPAAYRHDPDGRWKAQDAEKWLVFLARHLERKIASPDLAWWQLWRSMPRTAVRAVVAVAAVTGVVTGVVAGLRFAAAMGGGAVVVTEVVYGILYGILGILVGIGVAVPLAVPLVGGLGGWSSGEAPARGVRIRAVVAGLGGRSGARAPALIVAVLVVVALLVVGLVPGAASAAGVAVAVAAAVAAGIEGVPGDLAEAASPRAVLAHDRRAALLLMLAAGVAAGYMIGPVSGAGAEVAALAGAGAGVGLSALRTAWPSYLLTIGWPAFSHRLPRSLMGFLADAHQRGALRQAGAFYQFRHIDLQHRLATRP
jgi:NACHT domain